MGYNVRCVPVKIQIPGYGQGHGQCQMLSINVA
jgi:hypothetical protein